MPRLSDDDSSSSLSGSQENDSNSSSEELESPENRKSKQRVTEYEKRRLERIEENKLRIKALGIEKMASSFVGSSQKKTNEKIDRKGKRKIDHEDEEYFPHEEKEEDKGLGSSSEDEDEEFLNKSKKINRKGTKSKKKNVAQNLIINSSDYADEDDNELLEAIALSMRNESSHVTVGNGGKGESTPRKKKQKPISGRTQMNEDELILHFYQFDEAGKGSINVRDLRKIALAHDFTWTDKEMADMIHCFDSNGDGKISLDDFRKIVNRCHLLQGSDVSGL